MGAWFVIWSLVALARQAHTACQQRFVVLSAQRSGTELLASTLRAGGAGMRVVEPLWHCRTSKLRNHLFAEAVVAARLGATRRCEQARLKGSGRMGRQAE